MTAKNRAADHHVSAATYHDQAAGCHRKASRHFEAGKESRHWAHQALMAHGHTLQAIESGNEAHQYYARHNGNWLPKHAEILSIFPTAAIEAVESMGGILTDPQRHTMAANHHEEAAKCHRRASTHCAGKEYNLAAHDMALAHDHAQKAAFHSHEATKQYFDRNAELDATSQDLMNWTELKMIG